MALANTSITFDDDREDAVWRECAEREQSALEAVLEARKLLEIEIQKLVATHRNDEAPPFSNGELIVMPIIDSNKEVSSNNEMVSWILESLLFHKQAVVGAFLDTMYADDNGTFDLERCMAL